MGPVTGSNAAHPDPAHPGPERADPNPAAPAIGARFRPHGALAVAAAVATLGALPLVTTAWLLAPVLLVPLAVLVWALRSGTVADAAGLRVRALFGQRFVPWTEVEELAVQRHDRVVAVLGGHRSVWLTAVRRRHIPVLIAIAGRPPADEVNLSTRPSPG